MSFSFLHIMNLLRLIVKSKGGVFGVVVPYTMFFISENRGPSLFSNWFLPVIDGVIKNCCQAKSERTRYSIVMVLTESFLCHRVDPSNNAINCSKRLI